MQRKQDRREKNVSIFVRSPPHSAALQGPSLWALYPKQERNHMRGERHAQGCVQRLQKLGVVVPCWSQLFLTHVHETLLHVKLMQTPTDRSWARFCTTFEGLPAAAALSVHGLNHTLRQGGRFWVGDTHICMQPKFLTHKKLLLFHQVPVQSVH